tara:strand:+ start:8273 stop:8443 length:171 start_codon:yes stop_codon:yes gene_type:complete
MEEIKDTAANLATIGGSGAVVMNWNEWLTLALIVTGIVLNVIRIYEIKRSRKKQDQ